MAVFYAIRYPNHWRWWERCKQGALVAAVTWVCIHAMYEFRGTLVPLGRFEFVSQTGFNRHLRYVLPFLPCFYLVIASGMGRIHGWRRWAVGALVAWYAISSLSILPRSYAYFSEAVGGASQGWKYLSDSNLDWGQDILAVKHWVNANPDKRPVFLLYSPSRINYQKLGIDAQDGYRALVSGRPKQPGWWIACASPLQDLDDPILNLNENWFRERPPTERISVVTTVYYVSEAEARENLLSSSPEAP